MRREHNDVWVGKVTEHYGRFRFRMGRGSNTTACPSYQTLQEAEKARTAVVRQQAARAEMNLEDTLRQYELYLANDRGNKSISVSTEIRRVTGFLDRESGPLPRFTEESAAAAYKRLVSSPTRRGTPPAAAEHQNCLKAMRRFGKWLVKQRFWRDNPLLKVDLIGKPKAGEESKRQFGIDQGRMWLNGALAAFELGDQSALAAVVLLVMGLRSSEIAKRRVSHLDDKGRRLRIPESKTPAGRRGLPVPYPTQERPDLPDLRGALMRQTERARAWGREQEVPPLDPPLFPPIPYDSGGNKVNGGHLSGYSIRRAVHRVCRAVGLPLVCPHALRGTFTSIGIEEGVAIEAVARALGHAGTGVTKRHYATADAQAAGRQRRALDVLEGGKEETEFTDRTLTGRK